MVPSIQAQIRAMNVRRNSRTDDLEENLRRIVEFLDGRRADRIAIQRHVGCSTATVARYMGILLARGQVAEELNGRLLQYELTPREIERMRLMEVEE